MLQGLALLGLGLQHSAGRVVLKAILLGRLRNGGMGLEHAMGSVRLAGSSALVNDLAFHKHAGVTNTLRPAVHFALKAGNGGVFSALTLPPEKQRGERHRVVVVLRPVVELQH